LKSELNSGLAILIIGCITVIVISPFVDLPLTLRTDGSHPPGLLDGGTHVTVEIQVPQALGRITNRPRAGAAPLPLDQVAGPCALLC
jgi:hypothetical protein